MIDWASFFLGFVIGALLFTYLVAIASDVGDIRDILRELACCEALKQKEKHKER